MGPEDWLNGSNVQPAKISLDPKKRPKETLTVFQEKPLKERQRLRKPSTASSNGNNGEVRFFKRFCLSIVHLTFVLV